MSALLEIRDLAVAFDSPEGSLLAIDALDLDVAAGEALALVGESGCGKTLAALAVMGVLPPAARVVSGTIRFGGRDLLTLDPRERRALCGRELAMSFQDPSAALDPVFPVGEQIAEGLRHHAGLSFEAAARRTGELFGEVGLAPELARRYPHELSGGQRQRALLAAALACGPSLLIADEPTSALDASVQVEILALLGELRARREMALLLVTHDLAVVAELAGRMAVMYAGRIVEEGPVLDLFEHPAHPYTLGLLRSRTAALARGARFAAIPGSVPPLGAWPSGCRFRTRCPLADEACAREDPRLLTAPPPQPSASLRPPDATHDVVDRRVACHHAGEAV